MLTQTTLLICRQMRMSGRILPLPLLMAAEFHDLMDHMVSMLNLYSIAMEETSPLVFGGSFWCHLQE